MSTAQSLPSPKLSSDSDLQTRVRVLPGLESVKWLALLAMTVDHVNTLLLSETQPWMHSIGRLALPLFSLAFGFGVAARMDWRALVRKLIPFAIFAQIAWLLAGHGSIPNVLFTFALCVCVIALYPRTPMAAIMLGVVLGYPTEGTYCAIALVLGAYCLAKGRSTPGWVFLGIGTILACVLSNSTWPAAAVPLYFLLMHTNIGPTRRAPQFLYWYYPIHILVLAACARASSLWLA